MEVIIKMSLKNERKEIDRLEKTYNEESSKYYENNERIQAFLSAIVSKDERCLLCGEKLDDYVDEETALKNHEFGYNGHKYVKGFKNKIVKEYHGYSHDNSEIKIGDRETIIIKDYELYVRNEYTTKHILESFNHSMDSYDGTIWYPNRKNIMNLFKDENMTKLFNMLKDGITNNIEYKKKHNLEAKNTLKNIDKILKALGGIN
jgi:hypothetical protein